MIQHLFSLAYLLMEFIILVGHSLAPANMWRIDLDDINISMSIPNVYGCTDTVYKFWPSANTDDGSCVYCVYGCMDSTAL